MNWDQCFVCQKNKNERLRGKTNNVEWDQKVENSRRKCASLLYELSENNVFSIESFENNDEESIFSIIEEHNGLHHHSCVLNLQTKLKRHLDKVKNDSISSNKRQKRSDSSKITLGEFKCLFCGKEDDVSNLCAGGTLYSTKSKINHENNKAFSEKLWMQASRLQNSRVLNFLSQGTAAAREMNYHKACLTKFHNSYRSLVNLENSNISEIDFKKELHFRKVVSFILSQRRLGTNTFKLIDLENMFSEYLAEDSIQYSSHVTRFGEKLIIQLGSYFEENDIEIRTINRCLSLMFKEDIDEIIKESMSPSTYISSLLSIISPIRAEMSKVANSFSYSFTNDSQMSSVPIQLQVLCSLLVDGCDPNLKGFSQSSLSIAQLVMYQYRKITGSSSVTTVRRHSKERETPVPVYVGLKLYSSLRSKTVIQRFFSLGLCISYDRVLEICNNISLNLLKRFEHNGVFVAGHLTRNTFTIIAKDNIDLNSRSTKQKKHFHGISMSTMQFPSSIDSSFEHSFIYDLSLVSSKKLSLPEDYEIINDPPFRPKTPLELPVCTINFEYEEYQVSIYEDQLKREIGWLSQFEQEKQPWSSFHSKSSSELVPGKHSLMPLINEKVNTLKAQYHTMNIIKKTIEFTNEGQIPVDASDQPVYALSKEVQIGYNETFGTDKYVCMLGDLHMEHTALLVHGDLIRGSGLDSQFVNTKLSTEGTSTIVDVNDIKRSRYCLQVSVVVIYNLLKKAYLSSGSKLSILEWLDEEAKTSQMCFYWRMILNYELLVLLYVRSIRQGNFELYLACIYRLLPWFFALDRYNYARWGTVYWFDMVLLENRCPSVYESFKNGNFSFLKTKTKFSRIALDQLHEQNNKYIKSVSGATVLVNREDDGALVRWELCGPELARILEEFEDNKVIKLAKHHEDTKAFIRDFEKDVDTLSKSFSSNPFLLGNLTVINNTDMAFEPNVFHNLQNLLATGEKQLFSFIKDRLVMSKVPISSKISLNSFELPGSKKPKKKLLTSADPRLNQATLTKLRSAITYRREQSKVLFSSEIYGYCQSLSENGSDLYHGSKSSMLNRFECVDKEDILIPSSSAIIIELSPLFRTYDGSSKTFKDFARYLYDIIMKLSNGYSRVDVICDRYFPFSLKNLTRSGRGNGPRIDFDDTTLVPSRFVDSFMKNNDNKERLNLYCADKFYEFQLVNPSSTVFNVTKNDTILTNSASSSVLISSNTAEEADQKIVRHMLDCIRNGIEHCMIRTVDTDVIVSLISFRMIVGNFNTKVFACLASSQSNKFFDINKICQELGDPKCKALPFVYAFSGCDIVSSFFNQGKCKMYDRWLESPEELSLTSTFSSLSNKPIEITDDQISIIERYVGFVYYGRYITSIDCERLNDFEFSLHGNLRMIPPSRSGLIQHIKRAAYYSGYINRQCIENIILPLPNDWGWTLSDGIYTPNWVTSSQSIDIAQLTTICSCSSASCIRCKCSKLNCLPYCKCQRKCIYKPI